MHALPASVKPTVVGPFIAFSRALQQEPEERPARLDVFHLQSTLNVSFASGAERLDAGTAESVFSGRTGFTLFANLPPQICLLLLLWF